MKSPNIKYDKGIKGHFCLLKVLLTFSINIQLFFKIIYQGLILIFFITKLKIKIYCYTLHNFLKEQDKKQLTIFGN